MKNECCFDTKSTFEPLLATNFSFIKKPYFVPIIKREAIKQLLEGNKYR